MKEKARKLIVSLAAGAALTLTMNAKVYAETTEPSEDLFAATEIPGEPAVQEETSLYSQQETAKTEETETKPSTDHEAEQTKEEGSEVTVSAEEKQELQNADEEQKNLSVLSDDGETAFQTPAQTNAADAEEVSSSTSVPAEIHIGETLLSEETGESGWNSTESSGWRYNSTSKTVSLVNCGSVDITSDKDVSLAVAGLNRIGTLYSDGDVTITGTGIVLIDSIDLIEGASLKLCTPSDIYEEGAGSAAVFLKTEEGYVLINGSVTGLLDEAYVVPEGITLIIPEGGTLELKVLESVTKIHTPEDPDSESYEESYYGVTSEDYNKCAQNYQENVEKDGVSEQISYRLNMTFSSLTTLSGSSLVVASGAAIKMDTTTYNDMWINVGKSTLLNIQGSLTLLGTITGDQIHSLVPRVDLSNSESVTGTGTFNETDIIYGDKENNDDTINLGEKNFLSIDGEGPKNLNVSGKENSIFYKDGAELTNVNVSEDAELTAYMTGDAAFKFRTLNVQKLSGTICTGSGKILVSGILSGVDPSEAEETWKTCRQNGAIPVSSGKLIGAFRHTNHYGRITYTHEQLDITGTTDVKISTDAELSYSMLSEYFPDPIDQYDHKINAFLIYALEDGKVVPYYLDKNTTTTISAGNVFCIYAVRAMAAFPVYPASGVNGSTVVTTGSGILGGSNAGTMNGGTPNSILTGKRQAETPADPTGPDAEEPAAPEEDSHTERKDSPEILGLSYRITPGGNGYRLEVLLDGQAVTKLSNALRVYFRAEISAEWNRDDLYAVFTDEQGNRKAVKVEYDSATGRLYMDTSMVGEFRLVMLHWTEEFGTVEFYEALVKLL